MALRAWFNRAAGMYSQSQVGIRTLKPWQHGTINIWITHYYGRPRPYLYDVGQEMSVRAFESRLERAKEFFDFVPISQHFSNVNPRAVALTFDDGLNLEREGVLDVLERLGIRATFYLMTASLDNKHLMWRNALSAMGVEGDAAKVVEAYSHVCDEPLRTPAQGASAAMQWPASEIDERTRDDVARA